MIDVTYLGNHGVKLPFGSVQKDQLPPQDLAQGNALTASVTNPFYGAIAARGCGLNNTLKRCARADEMLKRYIELLPGDTFMRDMLESVEGEQTLKWA